MRNAGNPEVPQTFGHVDFLQAYEHSINAVFCNIGMKLGAAKITDKAKDFGFYSRAADRAAVVTGRAERRVPLPEGRPAALRRPACRWTRAASRFGQDKLLVTPLQMALVAAGVANGGTSWSRTSSRR